MFAPFAFLLGLSPQPFLPQLPSSSEASDPAHGQSWRARDRVPRVRLHLGPVPLLCWASPPVEGRQVPAWRLPVLCPSVGVPTPPPRGPSWPRASALTQTIQEPSSSPSALTASALAVILQGGASVDCAPFSRRTESQKVGRTAPGPTSMPWAQVPAHVQLAQGLLESVGPIFLLCSSSRDGIERALLEKGPWGPQVMAPPTHPLEGVSSRELLCCLSRASPAPTSPHPTPSLLCFVCILFNTYLYLFYVCGLFLGLSPLPLS